MAGVYRLYNCRHDGVGGQQAAAAQGKFPMELFLLTRVYTALINLGYSLAAYAVMLAVFGVMPQWPALISP